MAPLDVFHICSCEFQPETEAMETLKNVLYLTTMFWSVFSAQDVQEPTFEITTENSDFLPLETTEVITESPEDGMTVGDIPTSIKLESPRAAEGKEEEPFAVEDRPVVVSFPDNHKNFTASLYLGDREFPPYLRHLNPYQQQYKNYFEQKQTFSRKPIKFEEDSVKNLYVPLGANSLDFGDEKKNEDMRINRKPFPYAFENERNQEQANWYKTTKQVLANEQSANEHGFPGHQEHILPYYVFHHNYPPREEEKFYKNEFVHFDQHPVKKDEKENPWKKVFHVLSALVPLGLLLATLTPNVISINSTATTKTTRQRSEDSPPLRFQEEDVLKLMKKYGVESLSEGQCEEKVLCELAREGGKNSAGPIEKGFWFLANQTPWDTAEKAGMNELFKAIKTGKCDAYKCHSKTKSDHAKKLVKKHKVKT